MSRVLTWDRRPRHTRPSNGTHATEARGRPLVTTTVVTTTLSRRRLTTLEVAALAAVPMVLTGGPAWASDGESAQPGVSSHYYLALGDSLPIGVQPDAAASTNPRRRSLILTVVRARVP